MPGSGTAAKHALQPAIATFSGQLSSWNVDVNGSVNDAFTMKFQSLPTILSAAPRIVSTAGGGTADIKFEAADPGWVTMQLYVLGSVLSSAELLFKYAAWPEIISMFPEHAPEGGNTRISIEVAAESDMWMLGQRFFCRFDAVNTTYAMLKDSQSFVRARNMHQGCFSLKHLGIELTF
jgi:hypothetical protein